MAAALTVSASVEPNQGAIRFYQCHGFTTVEHSDGRGNPENIPDRLMFWQP